MRNIILLAGSLTFYAWGEPIHVLFLVLSIFVAWIVGLALSTNAGGRRVWLAIGVSYYVGMLVIFKYLTFIAGQIGLLLSKDINISIALPIGISFYSFQLISYIVDVYRRDVEAQKNPFYVGLYVALFPQLIAGPIVRYKQIASEILERDDNFNNVIQGTERFIYGIGKKVLIADYLGWIADIIFGYSESSVFTAWLGAISYTLQIYYDFSGYSDMAIGLGRMFGFRFEENFDYPYISGSITEFWRRWHISLSSWFRDYIYVPLGGNRVTKMRWVLNLFITWTLTGIWHGANWTFLSWGLFYFVILLIEKNVRIKRMPCKAVSHIYVMLTVTISWVIFKADSLAAAGQYLHCMFCFVHGNITDGLGKRYFLNSSVILIVGLILCMPVYPKLLNYISGKRQKAAEGVRSAICIIVFILAIVQVIGQEYSPFIYFNF